MKKIILKLIVFFALCVGIDQLVGLTFGMMREHARGGKTLHEKYISNTMQEELIIMGSSRAVHHYVPSTLSDSLGISAYNIGSDGTGIIYNYAKLQTFRHRYQPKVILLEFTPSFDLLKGESYLYDQQQIRSYYDFASVRPVLWHVDPMEKYKMRSQAYRYNSRIFEMGRELLPVTGETQDGYVPLYGKMKHEPQLNTNYHDTLQIDSLRWHYFQQFVAEVKTTTHLIILVSPTYQGKLWGKQPKAAIDFIHDYCTRENIPFLDYHADTLFSTDKQYWEDACHLNTTGVDAYMKHIIPSLRTLLSQ